MSLPVNKVEAVGLQTIDLTQLLPLPPTAALDLAGFLEEGLLLREKPFRSALAAHPWSQYRGQLVAIFVSTEAIVPLWAYLLVGMYLAPHAAYYGVGSVEEVSIQYRLMQIEKLDAEQFRGARLLIKGCTEVSPAVLTAFFRKVMPAARLVFYGEACSSVPVYKAK